LLGHGRWFSSGTPASSTTKTGRHDIAEILLKVALNTKKSEALLVRYGGGGGERKAVPIPKYAIKKTADGRFKKQNG
jgi:hypothetical protein